MHPAPRWVRLVGLLALGSTLFRAADSAPAAENSPLYFTSAEETVAVTAGFLAARDWATLARYYDLSGASQAIRGQLLDGSYFLDTNARPNTAPDALARWREPFPPDAKLISMKPLGPATTLPSEWMLTTVLSIDQGGGVVQRAFRTTKLRRTASGFQFVLSAPKSDRSPAAPTQDARWDARGADGILFFRPELRARAEAELARGGASNIPALVESMQRLKPLAAQKGATLVGSPPAGPAIVYAPTDDELMLSLAGDRIWRSTQLMPAGTLAAMREKNPSLTIDAIEYPHIEIVRVEVAGSGPVYYAKPPVMRRVSLREPAP